MRIYDIIEKKRDGNELSKQEIEYFIKGVCDGSIADYQTSALLMAIYINGMNSSEIANMTMAMVNTGKTIDLSEIEGIKVDKHSTGGVGDKTTLIVAPIVAVLGIPVAKMSGKGLGHTGGTIDKLESIPGFNTNVTTKKFIENIKDIGLCIAGQTQNLVPADKKLYAIRNATSTVDSIPLIASSIMSKKIASGADKIVLDVKTGSGAFMKNIDESVNLAQTMINIGKSVGKETVAFITNMDEPLGNNVGNSLEVIEAIEVLKGSGSEDLKSLSFELSATMVSLATGNGIKKCREDVTNAVENGSALKKFSEMIEKQGGDSSIIYDYKKFGEAVYSREIYSSCQGYINQIDTEGVGKISSLLGAGREKTDSVIDYCSGIVLKKKTGEKVLKGEPIAQLFSNNKSSIENASSIFEKNFNISEKPTEKKPVIISKIN